MPAPPHACPARPARRSAGHDRGDRHRARPRSGRTRAAARARTCSCALPFLQPALDTRDHIGRHAFLLLARINQRKALRILLRTAAEYFAHALEEIVLLAFDAVRPQVT